ncbi:hypothetical protein HOY82DRAFT_295336 [Tuber indicum]|nr:hypothetical protein HOY82DRAFT_295336 [Tuber indicum]
MKNSSSTGLHADSSLLLYRYLFYSPPPFFSFILPLSRPPSLCVSCPFFLPLLILTSLPLLSYSTVHSHLLIKFGCRPHMCLPLGPERIHRPARADRQGKQHLLPLLQGSQPASIETL